MTYNPDLQHRRSLRLRHYDYAWPGVYFVTIVVRRRLCLLGKIEEGQLQHTEAGQMVAAQWLALAERFPFCEPSSFVVMPNHFHGLLILHGTAKTGDGTNTGRANTRFAPTGTLDESLGRVLQAYKSLTTHLYIQGVRNENWPPFDKQLWLRNYWERVVRDEKEWRAMHEYIEQNPGRWLDDKHHPEVVLPTTP